MYPDSVNQAGLKTGSKVMLLGKKYDPAQEEGYRKVTFKLPFKKEDKNQFAFQLKLSNNVNREVLEAEKKGSTVEMKLAKITNEVKKNT